LAGHPAGVIVDCRTVAGVREVAASTLFLRPAIADALRRGLPKPLWLRIRAAFAGKERLELYGTGSRVWALPAAKRQAIHDRVAAAAARHGIEARVCACKNPDLTAGCCGIEGARPAASPQPRQLRLFGETTCAGLRIVQTSADW